VSRSRSRSPTRRPRNRTLSDEETSYDDEYTSSSGQESSSSSSSARVTTVAKRPVRGGRRYV
jgi:hypothetical protein